MEKKLADPPLSLTSSKRFTEDLLKDRSALCLSLIHI